MLDTAPPPAIYEEAPSGLWLPKRFSVADHQVPREAILPGMTPYPGLLAGSGSAGMAQVPPTPRVSTYSAQWNAATATGVAYAAPAFTATANSAIIVKFISRTGTPTDFAPVTQTLTDNQGGTYTQVGDQLEYGNGVSNHIYCSLWVRDQKIASTASLTVTATHVSTQTSLWITGLIVELKNPSNLPFKYALRAQGKLTTTGNMAPGNSGDLYCLDFHSGGGAGSLSANSGFQQLYSSTGFVSSNLRITFLASYLRAQSGTRAYGTTNGGEWTSLAVWFEVPRSKPKMTWSVTDQKLSTTYLATTTFTGVNIGPAAADRQVLFYVSIVSSTASNISVTAWSDSLGSFYFFPITQAAFQCIGFMALAHIPSGTSLDLSISCNVIAYCAVSVFTIYGAAMHGHNQSAALLGEATPGFRLSQANSQSATISQTGIIIPKDASMLGGSGSRGGGPNILSGDWAAAAAGLGTVQTAGFRDNVSGADETGKTFISSWTGNIAMNAASLAMGP